ncbi:hypothetical protein [uncultured Vagococcus sp.]|nr:hypothetical protein [uncultured Vagococcus sp.]
MPVEELGRHLVKNKETIIKEMVTCGSVCECAFGSNGKGREQSSLT